MIKKTDLAQYTHIQLLKRLEKQSVMAYRFIANLMVKAIIKTLKSEKLAKSNKNNGIGIGWTREAPKIELNLDDIISSVIGKHLDALKWILIGDMAGKDAKKAAKDLKLTDKFVPGLLQSAYLASIDAQREHHVDITGEKAPELPKDLIHSSINEIVDLSNKVLEYTFAQIRFSLAMAIDTAKKSLEMNNLNKLMEEAHDILPVSEENAVSEAAENLKSTLASREVSKVLAKTMDMLEDKWRVASTDQIHKASSVGTHQAMMEIYGSTSDSVRVVWMEMEDERVCSFCHQASKKPDGSFKFYKITDFKPIGANYGKKKSEWVLTIPPAHVNCRCSLVYVPRGFTVDKSGNLIKINK